MTMKNVHVIPTDKPSRLHLGNSGLVLCDLNYSSNTINSQNIYITSDEEIKEGDWFLEKAGRQYPTQWNGIEKLNFHCKKIILTTDQDLIKDGVQAIDDTFLEWFIKNPSCKSVKTQRWYDGYTFGYKIIIPKEDPKLKHEKIIDLCGGEERFKEICKLKPKQETLEEAADLWSIDLNNVHPADSYIAKTGFIAGAKWMQEQFKNESTADYIDRHIVQVMVEIAKQKMFEEVKKLIVDFLFEKGIGREVENVEEWFEQYKKK